MKKEIKDKWVAALRSGDYEQGKYKAKIGNKYCCLGVLIDVFLKEKGLTWLDRTTTKAFMGEDAINYAQSVYLPKDVADWAALKTPIGVYGKMNDFQNKTFNEIADFIEEKEV